MMAAIEKTYGHIAFKENGVPIIADTRIRVIDLVMAREISGYTLEELPTHFPPLTLSQVHAAFAYYYDNQEILDAAIRSAKSEYDEQRPPATSPLRKRLRSKNLI